MIGSHVTTLEGPLSLGEHKQYIGCWLGQSKSQMTQMRSLSNVTLEYNSIKFIGVYVRKIRIYLALFVKVA